MGNFRQLTWKEVRHPPVQMVVAGEVVDGIGIAADEDQRVGNVGSGGEVKLANILLVAPVESTIHSSRGATVHGRDDAERQVFDVLGRDDSVFGKATCLCHLEREHDAQVAHLLARHDEAVALSSISVVGAVKLDPVDTEHGGQLDEVAPSGCPERLLDARRHCVVALGLLLHRHYERMATKGGLLLVRRGHATGFGRSLLEPPFLPLL